MVLCEIDRGNIFKRIVRSNLANTLTPLVTMTRKWPRPGYAQVYFDLLCNNFQDLGRYFPVLGTLN